MAVYKAEKTHHTRSRSLMCPIRIHTVSFLVYFKKWISDEVLTSADRDSFLSYVYRKSKKIKQLTDVVFLFSNLQKESQKDEAAQMQRRHERKKEKRKKSARLQLHVQEQSLDQSQTQAGTTGQTEDIHIQPQPIETPPAQTEKPQKTVIKTEPKTPKARARLFSLHCSLKSLQILVNKLVIVWILKAYR